MVFIPGGTFLMGDVPGDSLYPDERPLVQVRVADFFIAATETSFDDYDAFCSATGRRFPSDNGWGRAQRPVFHVDWYDAAAYCNWRSLQEGLTPCYLIEDRPSFGYTTRRQTRTVVFQPAANGYRLPTEAEWEYAARAWHDPATGKAGGGGPMRFANSAMTADPDFINFRADSVFRKPFARVGVYRQQTVPVAALPANALGLHEMSGNLFEWCEDWYHERRYSTQTDFFSPPDSGTTKVARGGSWFSQAAFCRTAYRFDWPPDTRCALIGFRVARSAHRAAPKQ